ncbi:MAG: hypothetical protein JO010_03160 [Alphaproteobacteria bacterium]|nr:hypothetical protein [Alphaproteobacteria bacterium]
MDRRLAQAACELLTRIPGVTQALGNPVTGSLIISYDRRRVSPAILWEALCGLDLASGPMPIRDGAAVTRMELHARGGGAGRGLIDLVAGHIVEKLVERSAVALLGALI